jgi:hypothetical protein
MAKFRLIPSSEELASQSGECQYARLGASNPPLSVAVMPPPDLHRRLYEWTVGVSKSIRRVYDREDLVHLCDIQRRGSCAKLRRGHLIWLSPNSGLVFSQ